MEFFWRSKRGGAYTGLVIFHPKSTFIQARPGWIYDSQYKEVEIFIPDRLTGSTQMILANKKGEGIFISIPLGYCRSGSGFHENSFGFKIRRVWTCSNKWYKLLLVWLSSELKQRWIFFNFRLPSKKQTLLNAILISLNKKMNDKTLCITTLPLFYLQDENWSESYLCQLEGKWKAKKIYKKLISK